MSPFVRENTVKLRTIENVGEILLEDRLHPRLRRMCPKNIEIHRDTFIFIENAKVNKVCK